MNVDFRMLYEKFLDLIYPSALYCICCGKIIDASRPYRLCNECIADIRWADGSQDAAMRSNRIAEETRMISSAVELDESLEIRTCQKCGKILSRNNPMRICYSCREYAHVFDMGFTCCEYGMNPRSMLFALKYHGRTDIGITIAEIMHNRMGQLRMETGLVYDAILPVPMSEEKRRQRGYNQAAVIARELACLEETEYLGDALQRVRNTAPLRGMAPAERRQVLAGAMEVAESAVTVVSGKDLLLIDDIYTTGSTVDAAAEVLLAAGAERVYILTFAAGADVIKAE
jgi:competence protein ComFC